MTVEKIEYFENIPIMFKIDSDKKEVWVRFDDNFAKANGFKDKGEFLAQDNCRPFELSMELVGEIPEWILVGKENECFI